jgi:hypothetical protein
MSATKCEAVLIVIRPINYRTTLYIELASRARNGPWWHFDDTTYATTGHPIYQPPLMPPRTDMQSSYRIIRPLAPWAFAVSQTIAKGIYQHYIWVVGTLESRLSFVILSKPLTLGTVSFVAFVQLFYTNLLIAAETLAVVNYLQRIFAQGF